MLPSPPYTASAQVIYPETNRLDLSVRSILRALAVVTVLIALIALQRTAYAQETQTLPGGGAVTIGAEIAGAAGPNPTCSDAAYSSARPQLEAQFAAWRGAALTAIPGAGVFTTLLPGPGNTPLVAPYPLTLPDGFTITVIPVDLSASQGYSSGSHSVGVPAYDAAVISGGAASCTLQDNSPKPPPALVGNFYFNQLSNYSGLNAIRFEFAQPVTGFGFFVGDLETSEQGTRAFLRLLDANGALIADTPIHSTASLSGGDEASVCNLPPDPDTTQQGLLPGCGTGTSRWLGVTSPALPVATALLVVGDNDPLPGGRGLSEKLSFIGASVVRPLAAAEVTVNKSAPGAVTAGTPFEYAIEVRNTGPNLAADVRMTDTAPAGLVFHAVAGQGCNLANNQVVCTLQALAAGDTATILIQASATATDEIINTATVSAANDSDPANNRAISRLTPLAPSPLNACAPAVGDHVLISEFSTRRFGSATNEFVELFNPTLAAVDLSGWSLWGSNNSAGITRRATIPAGVVLQPGQHYLIVHYTGYSPTPPTGNLTYTLAIADDGGLALFANSAGSGLPIDQIGMSAGSAYGEGTRLNALPSVSDDQSYVRAKPFLDSNNNAGDFVRSLTPTPQNLSAALQPPNAAPCNVAIAKHGPASGVVGLPFDYTIVVSNTTAVTLSAVTVSDTQPSGIAFNSVSGQNCNLDKGALACAVGALAPYAASLITVNATAGVSATLTNLAFANAISDSIAADNSAAHTMSFFTLGGIGDFVYFDNVNTNGSQDGGETLGLTGVPVSLTLPDGTTRATATVDGAYFFGALPPGRYTVTVGDAAGYSRTSRSEYTVDLGLGELFLAADFGFVYAAADVTLSKTAPALVNVGDAFDYTFQVTNLNATHAALNVVLSDIQPEGVRFLVTQDVRCALVAGQLACNLGDLPPGGASQVLLTAVAEQTGNFVNTATAAASNDANAANNSRQASLRAVAPAIALKKYTNGSDADLPPGPLTPVGAPVTWSYVVNNIGSAPLYNLSLSDDQLAEPIVLEAALLPGESASFTQTGTAVAGQYVNTAHVTATNQLSSTQQVSASDRSHYFGVESLLAVEVQTDPDGATAAFTFSHSVNNGGSFALLDGQRQNFGLAPGVYTIRQEVLPNWEVSAIFCQRQTGEAVGVRSADGRGVTVSLGSGETVHCLFSNRLAMPDTPTPTATSTDTPTETPTNTPTATPTPTFVPTDTATAMPTETATPDPLASPTNTVTPVMLMPITATRMPTLAPTATATATPTPTSIAIVAPATPPITLPVANPTPTLPAPRLTLEKRGETAVIVLPKDHSSNELLFRFALVYRNGGEAVASSVRISETVPVGVTFNAAQSSPGWNCPDRAGAGTQCVLVIGDLAANAGGSAVFAVNIDVHNVSVTAVQNTAMLAGSQALGAGAALAPVSASARIAIQSPTALDEADEPAARRAVFLPLVQH